MSQYLQASEQLRNCEVVGMNALLLFYVFENQVETLDQVLDLLKKALLIELLDHVLLLFQCGH